MIDIRAAARGSRRGQGGTGPPWRRGVRGRRGHRRRRGPPGPPDRAPSPCGPRSRRSAVPWARPSRPATRRGPRSSASRAAAWATRSAPRRPRPRPKWEKVHQGLLYLPNIPADEVPDGASDADNVEIRRWWPGQAAGAPEPVRLRPPAGAALGDRRGPAAARHGAGRPPVGLHVPPLPRRRGPAAACADRRSRSTATRRPTRRSARPPWC